MEDVVDFIYRSGETWWDRVHDDAATPVEPGSPLDDPELLPGEISVAELVWRLIADGGSHIAAHHKWVMASQGGMWLKPSMTLGRTALVCASRAMYVMTGESAVERRVRALQLLNDEAEGLVDYAKDMVRRGESEAADHRSDAEAYQSAVQQELIALGRKPGSKKSDTELLSSAARYFDEDKRHRARKTLEMAWRLASATVHGRAYTWDTGLEDRDPNEQLVAAWSMPSQLLEIAWDKWVEMSGNTSIYRPS